MSREDRIVSKILETQRRIGRLAARDHGLTLKAISLDSGIPYATVKSYFSQARDARLHEMPVSVFVKLMGIIPDDLLSQMIALGDRHLEMDEEDEDAEFDDIGDIGDEVSRLVRQAHHPKSPGGVEIIAVEEEAIRAAAAKFGRKQARLRIVA